MTTYLLPYTTGTASVTNGSPAVTGALTAWLANVKAGDRFRIGSTEAIVYSVESNTALTLATAWGGSTISGSAYAVDRFSRGWFSGGDLALLLALYNSNRPTFIPTNGAPSNSIGADGNIAVDATDINNITMYHKSGGSWSSAIPIVGTDGTNGINGTNGVDGTNGINGTNGVDGNDGWTAVISIVSDGERRVQKIVDWTGGEGTKPAVNKYVGASGLVDAIGDGVDVRGPSGAAIGAVKYDTAQSLSAGEKTQARSNIGAAEALNYVKTVNGSGPDGSGNATVTIPPSGVIQRAYAEYRTYTTGTTLIPTDDTIPQNTEGTEIMTVSITPTSATSKLRVICTLQGTVSVATNFVAAIFRDSTANALHASYTSPPGANYHITPCLAFEVTAGSTSATIFKLRVGMAASGYTWAVNGNTSNRFLGGAAGCSIIVEELAA